MKTVDGSPAAGASVNSKLFFSKSTQQASQLIRGRPTKVLEWLAISEASPMYRSQSITFVCHKVLFQATCFGEVANYFTSVDFPILVFCALKFPSGKPTCCSERSILRYGSTSGIVILHSIYLHIRTSGSGNLELCHLCHKIQTSTKLYKTYSQTC